MLEKLSKIEAIGLIVIIIINHIILNLPNYILMSTGPSAWINVIYISIVALFIGLLICKLFNPFENKDILDICKFLGGKFLKIVVGIIYMTLLFVTAFSMIRYFTNSLKLIYFTSTPLVFLTILLIIPVLVINRMGLKGIAKVNLIFMPILLVSILVVLFSTVKEFIPQRIFPILGYGIDKTFLTGLSNIFAFSGISYLYFLKPQLKDSKDFKKVTIISITLSAIYLFLSVVCLLLVFSFITQTDEMLSIYVLTRRIEYGRFFQRVDAIFIFFWIMAIITYVSLSLYYSLYIFKKLTNIKSAGQMSYSFCALLLGGTLIIRNIADSKFIESYFYKYSVIIVSFILGITILVLANLKLRRRQKKLQ